MVGYRISPLLWAKVKRGLSAGRVQSVALRIICDREAEIEAFVPSEYWTLDVDLLADGEKKTVRAKYHGDKKGKVAVSSKEEMDALLKKLENAKYQVAEVKNGERIKKAPLPLQLQLCSRKPARC